MALNVPEPPRSTSGVLDVVAWRLARGRRPQAFLDAWWVTRLLARVPERRRAQVARRILALSPHYFLNHNNWRVSDAALARQFTALQVSRVRLFDALLGPFVSPESVVLDFGCGPGLLSRAAAQHAKRVIAVDTASGVLACARVLSAADNITYLHAHGDLAEVPDASVDVVCSVAVLQHLSSDAIDHCLRIWRRVLADGGRAVVHVVLDSAEGWRQEEDWVADTSAGGRARYRLGLHCFARSAEWYASRFVQHGFGCVEIVPVRSLADDNFDDVCGQHVVMAQRAAPRG